MRRFISARHAQHGHLARAMDASVQAVRRRWFGGGAASLAMRPISAIRYRRYHHTEWPSWMYASITSCCISAGLASKATVLFLGDSLVGQLYDHVCRGTTYIGGTHACNQCEGGCLVRIESTQIPSLTNATHVMDMVAPVEPSLIINDYSALHLLHMHPYNTPCCRPWLDSRAQSGMNQCWELLGGTAKEGQRRDLATQTLCADFWGWVTLGERVTADAAAFRRRWPAVRLALMPPHAVCEAKYRGAYRAWCKAPRAPRLDACARWVSARLPSLHGVMLAAAITEMFLKPPGPAEHWTWVPGNIEPRRPHTGKRRRFVQVYG